MKSFKYVGKYENEDSLPQRVHPEGYVQYKEADSMEKLSTLVTILSVVIIVVVAARFYLIIPNKTEIDIHELGFKFFVGSPLVLLTLVPHEFLHGLAMNGEVKMYEDLKQGLMFVTSTDDMSKKQFIFMSMLPNLVFGFIPFIIFLIFPNLIILGSLGVFAIGAGAGDYYNVYNTITQVPDGAKVYMSGMHTYWYK